MDFQWQREAGAIWAMHRFSLTGQIAINKGCVARLSGKPIGLNGFNFTGNLCDRLHTDFIVYSNNLGNEFCADC